MHVKVADLDLFDDLELLVEGAVATGAGGSGSRLWGGSRLVLSHIWIQQA